jgi:hypothetical protein
LGFAYCECVPKRFIAAITTAVFSISAFNSSAHALGFNPSAKGVDGQVVVVNKTSKLTSGTKVLATGLGFNTKHGIYVAFCQIPALGQRPENCYGGINLDGKGAGSVWITNKTPFATMKLAKRFGKNGTFSVEVEVSRFIGTTDCKAVKCGVITRADHFEPDYRRADVLIPVTFK